jgi:hypothetical protein
MDDIMELLKKSEIPKYLKKLKIIITRFLFNNLIFRNISEYPVDENYEELIKELKELIEVSKDLQKRGFIIGFEIQKDLDPLIDRASKRILSTCTELLISNREMNKMYKWHDIQQQNLLPKSELIWFVEEQRPLSASTFIGKYCEMSSGYYASCAKGFFEDLKQNNKIKQDKNQNQPILIGDPIEGDKIRRRSSLSSLFFSKSTMITDYEDGEDGDDGDDEIMDYFKVPFNSANLLIELLKRESSFFKEFFGVSSYVRRKTILTKIFLKCFQIIKTNLKENFSSLNALESLKMMSELTNLEVQVSLYINDLSSPTLWLNEIQNLIFEDFKKLIRKQIESLSNYSELKINLSSSELRHHFVVKRFSNFMKNSLEILKTFQRPWEIVQVELKKLEHSFYGWMIKICNYLKDKRDSLIFQINNFDLVIETCSSVAGADFMASLQFKFDPLIQKFIKFELEKYFYDLLIIVKHDSNPNLQVIHNINLKLSSSFKVILDTFNSSTYTDFSNFKVSQLIRKKFEEETFSLYKKYFKICEELDEEIEIKPVPLEDIENILKITDL